MARKNLRKVKKGDHILYYHTGKEKAVVAEIIALADAAQDPNDDDPQAVVVKVKPVRKLPHPVSLQRIKGVPQMADWELVRLPRLSVMPVTEEQWNRIEAMSESNL